MNGEWSFHTSPNNSLLKFNSCVGFVTNTQTYSRRPHAIRFYVYLINSLSLSSLDRLSSTRVSGHNNKSEKKKQPPCQSHSRCMCMCFQIESNITSSECRLDSVYAEQSTLQDAVFCVPQKYEGIVASASCCTVHTHTQHTLTQFFFLNFCLCRISVQFHFVVVVIVLVVNFSNSNERRNENHIGFSYFHFAV